MPTAANVETTTRTFVNNSNTDVIGFAKTWGSSPIGGVTGAQEYKTSIIRPGGQASINYDNEFTTFSEITFLYPNNIWLVQRRFSIHDINQFSIYTLEKNGEVKMSNPANIKTFGDSRG
jgi:hypothetical protein